MENWTIRGADGIAINVTTASAVTDITGGGDSRLVVASDVLIDNPGPRDVFVKAGNAGAVATATSVRVPANSLQPFNKGDATHLAFISPSGSQAVVVHVGSGQ